MTQLKRLAAGMPCAAMYEWTLKYFVCKVMLCIRELLSYSKGWNRLQVYCWIFACYVMFILQWGCKHWPSLDNRIMEQGCALGFIVRIYVCSSEYCYTYKRGKFFYWVMIKLFQKLMWYMIGVREKKIISNSGPWPKKFKKTCSIKCNYVHKVACVYFFIRIDICEAVKTLQACTCLQVAKKK